MTLTELDLSWNVIKSAGAKHIAMGLWTARSIKNLSLSNNGIGDEGGIYLGQVRNAHLHSSVSPTRDDTHLGNRTHRKGMTI
jgi:Ran GTPase-activating protein (RanGAP) involved in mRNA processing and transport